MRRSITEFKAGDRVVIRDWDDMMEEYGPNGVGGIACLFSFTDAMAKYCGTELVVRCIHDRRVHFVKADPGHYNYSTDMIRHIDDPAYAEDTDYPEVQTDEFMSIILS